MLTKIVLFINSNFSTLLYSTKKFITSPPGKPEVYNSIYIIVVFVNIFHPDSLFIVCEWTVHNFHARNSLVVKLVQFLKRGGAWKTYNVIVLYFILMIYVHHNTINGILLSAKRCHILVSKQILHCHGLNLNHLKAGSPHTFPSQNNHDLAHAVIMTDFWDAWGKCLWESMVIR